MSQKFDFDWHNWNSICQIWTFCQNYDYVCQCLLFMSWYHVCMQQNGLP